MESAVRGLGGVLVGAAAALVASHIGMAGVYVAAVFLLVAIGLPLVVSGRLTNW
jgi:hypothetical protein